MQDCGTRPCDISKSLNQGDDTQSSCVGLNGFRGQVKVCLIHVIVVTVLINVFSKKRDITFWV